MKAIALGLLDDLRAKRLWPVALAMLLALIAVPVLLHKPSEEIASLSAETGASSTPAAPGGLPSPEEALAGNGQPLVTLATLRRPSTLSSFDVKNPFRPLRELDGSADTNAALAQTAGLPVGGGGIGFGGTGGSGGSVPSGGDTGGGTGTPGGDSPAGGGTPTLPFTDTPAPSPTPEPTPTPLPERRLAYAVDLTFDGPESAPRSYRNLPRLSILPAPESPLLVFLGVGADANSAVFLVDSKLKPVSGDAKCLPSPEECATLSIAPGEQQTFVDEQDRTYFLAIDQIREVPVRSASASLPDRPRAKPALGNEEPVRRFALPDLVDLVVTGGQR